MNKCMEFRVEGRISRRTWLQSVEVDKAELEINKEDVHDREKLRGSPIQKTYYKLIS